MIASSALPVRSGWESATSSTPCWLEVRVLAVSPPQGHIYTVLSRGKCSWLRVRSETALVSCMQDLSPEAVASNSLKGIPKWQMHTEFFYLQYLKKNSERLMFKDKLF